MAVSYLWWEIYFWYCWRMTIGPHIIEIYSSGEYFLDSFVSPYPGKWTVTSAYTLEASSSSIVDDAGSWTWAWYVAALNGSVARTLDSTVLGLQPAGNYHIEISSVFNSGYFALRSVI